MVLLVLVLVFALVSPVSAVDVGFSIEDMQSNSSSNPPEGLSTCFTLTPVSNYSPSYSSGSRSSTPFVTPTASVITKTTQEENQEENLTNLPETKEPENNTNTTTEIFHRQINQKIVVLPDKNLFYTVCFGVVFVLIVIFTSAIIIKQKRSKQGRS